MYIYVRVHVSTHAHRHAHKRTQAARHLPRTAERRDHMGTHGHGHGFSSLPRAHTFNRTYAPSSPRCHPHTCNRTHTPSSPALPALTAALLGQGTEPLRAGAADRAAEAASGPCSAHPEQPSPPALLAPPRRQPCKRRGRGAGGYAAGRRERGREGRRSGGSCSLLSVVPRPAPCAHPAASSVAVRWASTCSPGADRERSKGKRRARRLGTRWDSAQSPLPPRAGAPHLRSVRKLLMRHTRATSPHP